MDDKKKPFKAVMSGLISALTAATFALSDDHVTSAEAVGIALAAAVAFGAVYGIKNPKV